MQHIINLKTLLKCNKVYISIILFLITYVLISINTNLFISKYNSDVKEIIGIITSKKISDGKLELVIKGKEKILVNYYSDEIINLNLGDSIKVTGELTKPSDNTNFNLFNYRKYLLSKKIYWIFKCDSIILIKNNTNILYKIKDNMRSYINKYKSKIYIDMFVFGNNDLDDEINKSYQINGISHLFSISGMNITLFASVLLFVLKKITKNKKIIYIIISLFLLFYTFITSYSPPVLRGVYLFILLYLNTYLKTRLSTFKLLSAAFILMLIYNPFYIYNVGFLFSFIISFYLIYFSNLITKCKNYFTKLMMTSIISFLASIPIVINNYFELNLLSPIINLFFVPFVSIIIFPFALIVLFFPFLDNIFLFLISIMEHISLFTSKIKMFSIILCHMPFYLFLFYYIFITYILFLFKKDKYYSLIYILIALIIHNNVNYLNMYPFMTMIDVGQGDSFLIVLPYNKGNILVDTGGINTFYSSNYSIVINKTIPYLKSIGLKKIDYLILTHGDDDHMKEANTLISNFKVEKVFTNSGSDNELEKNLIKKPTKISEDSILIGGITFNFINNIDANNENEDSLIINVRLNNYNILLTGDAGIESEEYILKKYNIKNIDVLKVGHHGSKNSSSDIFLNQIKPKISLISVGINNKFNHPHPTIINKLNKIKSEIYESSIYGAVKLTFKDKIDIDTCMKKGEQ